MSKKIRNSSTQAKDLWDFLLTLLKFDRATFDKLTSFNTNKYPYICKNEISVVYL